MDLIACAVQDMPGTALLDQLAIVSYVFQQICELLVPSCDLPADENECLVREDACGPNAECMDTEGSFSCMCNDGYTRSGSECIGIKT